MQAGAALSSLSGLCGELVDISTCVKTHSFSGWQLLIPNRSERLQHCSPPLIFTISSQLSKITHLFIIIDHWDPSAALDNSYRRLAELRTWPGLFRDSRVPLALTCLYGRNPCFSPGLFIADSMLRHGSAGRVSRWRWSFGGDTEEEVCSLFSSLYLSSHWLG